MNRSGEAASGALVGSTFIPVFGRRHARRPALEQRAPQIGFKTRNRLRQRRLRQVHRPRSPRYAAVSYCRGKGGNVADVDRRFSHAATLSISLWEGANIALAGKDLPPHVFHQLKQKLRVIKADLKKLLISFLLKLETKVLKLNLSLLSRI